MTDLEEITNFELKNKFHEIYSIFKNNFDLKWGTTAAFSQGGIVFAINYSHGVSKALVAGLKQSVYTFLFGGFILKTCENLATKYDNRYMAYSLATIIPSIGTIGFTYLLHNLKGTPEPWHSTIPALFTPPVYFFWAYGKRKKHYETIASNT